MKCIYLRTNKINGKQYVGQTVDFDRRDYEWLHETKYSGNCINRARDKYGAENFTVKVLKECETEDELNQWEIYYINELNTRIPNGYNLTDGGCGTRGYRYSEESKKKMSENRKGRKPWNKGLTKEIDERVNKSSISRIGQKRSEESKKKISIAKKGNKNWLGKHHSEETKIKISEYQKQPHIREERMMNSKTRKETYQYTLDGVFIKKYPTINEAARQTNLNQANIRKCIRGEIKKSGGYIWRNKPL